MRMAMATFKIYKLHFTAPLHIGDQHADDGSSLKTIHSDTLYAALTACLAMAGNTIPEDGDLGFTTSSLFPYFQKDADSKPVYFLPMPMMVRMPELEDFSNAKKVKKSLYDHVVYDSTNERDFVTDLDTNQNVAVYVKLPDGFYISTPVGHYNPDWAIAFYEGTVKHIYFIAETKGSMSSMQLRMVEDAKIHCAREHFKAISGDNVVYDVVDSYTSLLEKVMK